MPSDEVHRPAVDQQVLAHHVAGVPAAQESAIRSQFLGIAEAVGGNFSGTVAREVGMPDTAELGELHHVGGLGLGGERAGQEVVDGHVARGDRSRQ